LRTHAKSAACRDTNQDPKSPSSGCLFRETLFGNVRVYNTVIKMVPIISRRGLGMGIAFLAFGFRSSWGGLIREVFCPASSEPARTGQSPGDPEVTHLLSSFHSETLIPLSLELNSELLFCIDLNHFETIFTFIFTFLRRSEVGVPTLHDPRSLGTEVSQKATRSSLPLGGTPLHATSTPTLFFKRLITRYKTPFNQTFSISESETLLHPDR
jgi:hypothetical protein